MTQNNFTFTIPWTFNAPLERVWKAWTNAEQLKQWFGPKGMSIRHSVLADLSPKGVYHHCMVSPNGNEMWGKWIFKDIQPPKLLQFINVVSNESGETIAYAPMPNWPLEVLCTATFTAKNSQTEFALTSGPYQGTVEESKTFENSQAPMQQGWSGAFEKLNEFLGTG